jgi:hypothetical protein
MKARTLPLCKGENGLGCPWIALKKIWMRELLNTQCRAKDNSVFPETTVVEYRFAIIFDKRQQNEAEGLAMPVLD